MSMILAELVIVSALTDLSMGKIYNMVVFPAFAAGILLRIEAGGIRAVPELLLSILLPALLLMPFWTRGIAAGDIKLLIAISVLLPLQEFWICSAASVLIAGIIALSVFIRTHDLHTAIPLAVPISFGVLFHLCGLY